MPPSTITTLIEALGNIQNLLSLIAIVQCVIAAALLYPKKK